MLIRFQFGMLIVSLRSRLFVSGLLRLEPRLWLKHRYLIDQHSASVPRACCLLQGALFVRSDADVGESSIILQGSRAWVDGFQRFELLVVHCLERPHQAHLRPGLATEEFTYLFLMITCYYRKFRRLWCSIVLWANNIWCRRRACARLYLYLLNIRITAWSGALL